MKLEHRWSVWVATVAAFFVTCLPVAAQMGVPDHAVPIGRGAGSGAFKSAIPGTAGQVLTSNGAASDPTFQNAGAIYYPACDITGVADCSTILQAQITAAETAGGGTIQLPCTGSGSILINTGVTISAGGIHVKGCGTGYEEYRGYQGQTTPQRGTSGTYINTTSTTTSPFTVGPGANGSRISHMAFIQAQPAEPAAIASFTGSISGTTLTVSSGTGIAIGQKVIGSGVLYGTTITGGAGLVWTVNNSQTVDSIGMNTAATSWTPTVYSASIRHAGAALAFTSVGSLEVDHVCFCGVYTGIENGTIVGLGTSRFTGRDYYHDIKGTVFATGLLLNAASDVTRIENIHIWPLFYQPPSGASTSALMYAQATATGIFTGRVDGIQGGKFFFYGINMGIRVNGSNPDGILQGGQVTNIYCDVLHYCIYADNISAGSGQYVLSIVNLTFNGFNRSVAGDCAVYTHTNVFNVQMTIVNNNVFSANGALFCINGTSNGLTLTHGQAFSYNVIGGQPMASVAASNSVRVYGDWRLQDNNSSPAIVSGAGTAVDLTASARTGTGNVAVYATAPVMSVPEIIDYFNTRIAASPGAAAVGYGRMFIDSTHLRFHDINSAGTIGTTVVADAGASNNFLTAISAAGVVSKAQPSFGNISGQATMAQLPVLTGYASGAGTVAATDTILQAIQKLNGNDALKLPLAGGTLTGNLLFSADNTLDIGADSATRPRKGFFGTSVHAGPCAALATQLAACSANGTNATFQFIQNGVFSWEFQNVATTGTFQLQGNSVTKLTVNTSGVLNVVGGYSANGAAGLSTTCTVTAGNSYVFTFGILTSKGANCS